LEGGVITQTAAGTKIAGDNPESVRLNPQLRKAASPLYEQAFYENIVMRWYDEYKTIQWIHI